jgi:hypothetical protein
MHEELDSSKILSVRAKARMAGYRSGHCSRIMTAFKKLQFDFWGTIS